MKNRVTLAYLVLALSLVASMLAIACTAQPGPIELKAVTVAPANIPLVASMQPFIERVNERAKGQLRIKYVGGPEAIGSWDQPDAVRRGVADIMLHYDDTARFPGGNAVFYTDLTAMKMRESGLYDLLAQMYKNDQNLVYLGMGSGYAQMWVFTKFPVKTPRDLAGHKFRGSPAWNEFLAALNVTGVEMPDEQLFTALEQGLVEGAVLNAEGVSTLGMQQYLKYVVAHPFYRTSLKFLMNKDAWNRLPENLQKLLMDVARELEPEQEARDAAIQKTAMEKLAAAGVQLVEFSSDDAKWFRDKAYDTMWEKIVKAHPADGPKLKKMAGR